MLPVRVHPNGRFAYSANRGHDTITVFRIDGETGSLSVVEREFVRGATHALQSGSHWTMVAGSRSAFHTLSCLRGGP